jgi:hypothetical protein
LTLNDFSFHTHLRVCVYVGRYVAILPALKSPPFSDKSVRLAQIHSRSFFARKNVVSLFFNIRTRSRAAFCCRAFFFSAMRGEARCKLKTNRRKEPFLRGGRDFGDPVCGGAEKECVCVCAGGERESEREK